MAICELGGGNFAKLAALPGYFKWVGRNAVFRTTGANLQHILNHWPEADWIGGSEEVKAQYLASLGVAADTAAAKRNPNILPSDDTYAYKRKPMEHQRQAFLLSRERTAFGLFMEQGTGKTKVTIDTACYLFLQRKITTMIVVAWPNGVHRNWVEYELPADMSVPYRAGYWAANHAAKHRQKQYSELLKTPSSELLVFTFNVEAFVSEAAKAFMTRLLLRGPALVVIDQSASIKNPQALRTKYLINKVSVQAAYRRVLDGAPVAEGADELYSQFKFLDPWIIGHDTWTGFKAEFCKIGYFNQIEGYKNLDVLRARIDGHCFRVLADDCLDLPPRIYKLWPFDLSAEEQRIFDELKVRDLAFFKRLDNPGLEDFEPGEQDSKTQMLEEHLPLVKNLRLQQISSGIWPAEDGRLCLINDPRPSRLEALLLLLAAAPGKALIFSRFRADLDLIGRELGHKAVSYHGGIPDDERDEAKRRFMTDPKVLYFVGQPRTAGLGHTLTAARHVIFYSNDDSLRFREECEKRAHRQGLKHKLIVWDLCARRTHDSKIIRAFRAKKQLANVIMQDPENFFLQHDEKV